MGGVTIAHQPIPSEVPTEEVFAEDFTSSMKMDSISQVVDDEQLKKLLAPSDQWPENLPIEDLTGEVQDLMMRESMTSWLQPWAGENTACLTDFDAQLYAQSIQLEDLFGQDQLNFVQNMTQPTFYDELTFASDDTSMETSTPTSSASSISGNSAQISPIVQPVDDALMEELSQETIVEKLKDLDSVEQIEVVEEQIELDDHLVEIINENTLKRRRDSTSSEESSDDSSSSSDSESESDEENVIPTTVANMSNRRQVSYSSSSESESDSEPCHTRRSRASSPISSPYIYMHKRQIEETVLDRITNNLNPEKLPGILSILASEKANSQQEDEVEIDLSCLAREQLIRVLSYVDACILEQNGGPIVNVNHYIAKKPAKKGPRTRPSLHVQDEEPKKSRQPRSRNRKPAKPRTKTRAELTEDIDADSSSSESVEYESKPNSAKTHIAHGPMSMASLSKKSNANSSSKVRGGQKKLGKANKSRNRRKGGDDDDVASSITIVQDPDSIASSRPKRRAAVHKRRLLEEMLAPSDNEADDDSEDSVLVVYSDEQMDLGVVDNQTIMHQTHASVQLTSTQSEQITVTASVTEIGGSEDTDEEIDIMC